jgi:hypothetical protein
LDQNALDLHLDQNNDSVYENQIISSDPEFDEEHLFLPPSTTSYLNCFFTICDFVLQFGVLLVMILNIANKEGLIEVMSNKSKMYN